MNCIEAILGSTGRSERLAEVRFEGVSKTFPPRRGGEPVAVLRELDLRISDGEFLVLVGPSGCGKSTLLRLLAGLEVGVGHEQHIPAATPIPTGGAPGGNIFFAPERGDAVATPATTDGDAGLINELHWGDLRIHPSQRSVGRGSV